MLIKESKKMEITGHDVRNLV